MPTISQYKREQFFRELENYREALRTGSNLVTASLRIHIALGDMPKSYKRFITQTWKETQREDATK